MRRISFFSINLFIEPYLIPAMFSSVCYFLFSITCSILVHEELTFLTVVMSVLGIFTFLTLNSSTKNSVHQK